MEVRLSPIRQVKRVSSGGARRKERARSTTKLPLTVSKRRGKADPEPSKRTPAHTSNMERKWCGVSSEYYNTSSMFLTIFSPFTTAEPRMSAPIPSTHRQRTHPS